MYWPITIDEPTAANRVTPFGLKCALPRNGKHRIRLNDIATGDTFTLTFAAFGAFGQTVTSGITFAADMTSAIDTAVEALTSIDTVSVVKVGGVQEYDVEYTGTSAATQIPLPTVTPTGFTALSTTRLQFGGPAGQPALGIVLATTDVQVTKNGGALAYADAAGSFVEIGNGVYHRVWALAEVNTEGYLIGTVLREELQVTAIRAWVEQPKTGAEILYQGTVVSATPDSVKLDALAPSDNGVLVDGLLYIYDGVGVRQPYRRITGWNGAVGEKLATISPNWVITPDATSKIIVYAGAPGIDMSQIATAEELRNDIVTRITTGEYPFDASDPQGRIGVRGNRGSL